MKLQVFKNSNKGVALTFALVVSVVVITLTMSILTITLSDYYLSVKYNDNNKAYILAESAIQEIISKVENEIAKRKEKATESAQVEAEQKMRGSFSDANNNFNAMYYDSTGDINEFFNTKFESIYQGLLSNQLDDLMSKLNGSDKAVLMNEWFGVYGASVKPLKNITVSSSNDAFVIFESANINKSSDKYQLELVVSGNYKDSKGISTRKISAKFEISRSNSYNSYIKNQVKDLPEKTNYLKNRIALCSDKNIVLAGGNSGEDANINGDIVCFGTIPSLSGAEDSSAQWSDYGGVIFGMTDANDTLDLGIKLGYDSNAISGLGGNLSCKANIIGNIATLGYVNSIYGNLIGSVPTTKIVIGDANTSNSIYARSFILSEYSSSSDIRINNNLLTLDDLRIDSDDAIVDIFGNYAGIIKAYYDISDSNSNLDNFLSKRTSSVVMNGNSMLSFKNNCFIGGSTFFRDYYLDEGGIRKQYMTGISSTKASLSMGQAYIYDANYNNKIYMYDSNGQSINQNASHTQYTKYSGGNQDMIIGGTDSNAFSISRRAEHFKLFWKNIWQDSNSIFYNPYSILMDNITYAVEKDPNDSSISKVKGFSYGALAGKGDSNGILGEGSIFAGASDFTQGASDYTANQNTWLKNYVDILNDFFDPHPSNNNHNLSKLEPDKSVMDSVYTEFNVAGNVNGLRNIVYEYPVASTIKESIMYFGDGDTHIQIDANNVTWIRTGSNLAKLTINKGIIFINGNLYIDSSAPKKFNFEGLIMSTQNIVILGNCNIRRYDPSGGSDIVTRMLDTDVYINRFFNRDIYRFEGEPITSQRINSNNIIVREWREVN